LEFGRVEEKPAIGNFPSNTNLGTYALEGTRAVIIPWLMPDPMQSRIREWQ